MSTCMTLQWLHAQVLNEDRLDWLIPLHCFSPFILISKACSSHTWMQYSFISFWVLICSSLKNTISSAAVILCSFLCFHDVLPQCKTLTFGTIKLPFIFCGHEVLSADETRTPPCYARANTEWSTVIFCLENCNVATAWFSASIPFIFVSSIWRH